MTVNVTRTGMAGKSPISIGRFAYGIENISIKQWNEGAALKIGSFCSIATSVTIFLGGNHRTDWITTFPFGHVYQDELGGADIKGHPATKGDVIIENDVWLGHNVTIMSGILIGNGAVVAANSTVVKNVSPYQVVGGNPANVIRQRFDDKIIELLLELKWWDLPIEIIREINKELSSPPDTERLKHLIERYQQ